MRTREQLDPDQRDPDQLVEDGPSHRRGAGAQIIGLAVSVALVAAVSLVGQQWTDTGAGSWYADLDKPAWNPPSWVFAPVWSILYLAMAVAAWLVWRDTDRWSARMRALGAYLVQLALNLGWTGVFFGLESPWWATLEIAGLLVAIAVTILLFGPLHQAAALLLVPYLAWVLFAASLTVGIAVIN